MKIRILIVVATCLGLAACATNYSADRVDDGVWKNFAYVTLSSAKVNPTEYQVIALGAGGSKEVDIISAWSNFASKIAGGRKFTKTGRLEDYEYMESYILHKAKRYVGTITIVSD